MPHVNIRLLVLWAYAVIAALALDQRLVSNISVRSHTALWAASSTSLEVSCDVNTQTVFLLAFALDGSNLDKWMNSSNWPTPTNLFQDISCTYPEAPNTTMYGACCWYGVRCCVKQTCAASDPDPMICNCQPGLVTGLSLPQNNVTGFLNAKLWQSLKCSLKKLDFNFNSLTNGIPAEFSAVTGLQELSLGYNQINGTIPADLGNLGQLQRLDLTGNHLAGAIPAGLCGNNGSSALTDILLGNNQLSGQLSIPYCNRLVLLDVSGNRLSGSVPHLRGYYQLHDLRMSRNQLNVSIPADIGDAKVLTNLDLSDNLIPGTLPKELALMRQLASINLHNNRISGTIPAVIFSNLGNLGTLDLGSNQLTGTIPDGLGLNTPLAYLDLSENWLTGTIPASLNALAAHGRRVRLSGNFLSCCGIRPVANARGMVHIGEVYGAVNWSAPRLPHFLQFSRFMMPLNGDLGINFTGLTCPGIRLAGNEDDGNSLLDWAIDPEYFLYEGCRCEQGYELVNLTAGHFPYYECRPSSTEPWFNYAWVIAIIVVVPSLALIWLAWLTVNNRARRPMFVQHILNMRKRVKGEPHGGTITVVNTDIEGYSDLMKQSPELMTRALAIHNNVIRKVRWQNFGFTVEQEGDSFSLVFYDAIDAVTFCLQSQQLLNKQAWPEGLVLQDGQPTQTRRVRAGTQFLQNITNNIRTSWLVKGIGNLSNKPGHESPGVANFLRDSEDPERTSRPSAQGPSPGCTSVPTASAPPAVQSAQPSASVLYTPKSLSGRNATQVFVGLRVRMGIATGHMRSSSVRSSPVMEMAKVVGDAGAGGEVLMDEATFAAIKERLEELGAVDHGGLNSKKLNAMRLPWWRLLWGRREGTVMANEAVVLDMGEYWHSPAKSLPMILQPSHTMGRAGSARTPNTSEPAQTGQDADKQLHLYQILAPPLVGRAKVFGNKLSLKEEWVQVDLPYFSAPGALDAPLGPEALEAAGALTLPAITMVFCIVDGGKQFAMYHRRDARAVHRVLAAAINNTLRQVPGGYLCRMQDGDLKYMVAFATPEAALLWCLALQEVCLHADWPEAALKYEKFKEEYDEAGNLVFRGPRIKMGVCEGSPKSILPDHLGRADYHGASINQAARYMDAAAHGGMIACEEALAVHVFGVWARRRVEGAGGRASTAAAAAAAVALAAAAGADAGVGGVLHAIPSTSGEGSEGDGAAAASGGAKRDGAAVAAAAGTGSGAVNSNGVVVGFADSHRAGAALSPWAAAAPASLQGDAAGAAAAGIASGQPSELAESSGSRCLNGAFSWRTAAGRSTLSSVREADSDHDDLPDLDISAHGSGAAPRGPVDLSTHVEGTPSGAGNSRDSDDLVSIPAQSMLLPGVGESVHGAAAAAAAAAALSSSILTLDAAELDARGSVDSAGPGGPQRLDTRSQPLLPPAPDSPPVARADAEKGRLLAVAVRATAAGAGVGQQQQRPGSAPAGSASCAVPPAAEGALAAAPESCPTGSPAAKKKGVRIMLPDEEGAAEGGAGRRASSAATRSSGGSGRSERVTVQAHRIGVFKFKGNPEAIRMVHVVVKDLAGRNFPADPPKGKGGRVAESSGQVGNVTGVELPPVVKRYRERWIMLYGGRTPGGGPVRSHTFSSLVARAFSLSASTSSVSRGTRASAAGNLSSPSGSAGTAGHPAAAGGSGPSGVMASAPSIPLFARSRTMLTQLARLSFVRSAGSPPTTVSPAPQAGGGPSQQAAAAEGEAAGVKAQAGPQQPA